MLMLVPSDNGKDVAGDVSRCVHTPEPLFELVTTVKTGSAVGLMLPWLPKLGLPIWLVTSEIRRLSASTVALRAPDVFSDEIRTS